MLVVLLRQMIKVVSEIYSAWKVEQFNHLLQLVAPYISKNNTQLGRVISARERLSITLRYLATGNVNVINTHTHTHKNKIIF